MGVSGQVSLSQQSLGVAAGLRLGLREEVSAPRAHVGWFGQGDGGVGRLADNFSYRCRLQMQNGRRHYPRISYLSQTSYFELKALEK